MILNDELEELRDFKKNKMSHNSRGSRLREIRRPL